MNELYYRFAEPNIKGFTTVNRLNLSDTIIMYILVKHYRGVKKFCITQILYDFSTSSAIISNLFQGHYMIEKAYDRKCWLFHANTMRYAKLISIQLLHTFRHFCGRFMLGYQKNVRVNHLKMLIFKAKSNPCNIK